MDKLFSFTYTTTHYEIGLFGLKIKIRHKFIIDPIIYKYAVNKNKIFLHSFSGAYTCNPKYIVEEILKQKLPVEIVWGGNENTKNYLDSFPKEVSVIYDDTNEYIKNFAESKILIYNGRLSEESCLNLTKKENQIHIQTWHGSLGIKKNGTDMSVLKKRKNLHNLWKYYAKQIDYLTSNSDFEDDIYKNLFYDNGKILKIGNPRNDIFFKDNSAIKTKIFNKYNIPDNSKIIMYAPTFRDFGLGYDVTKENIYDLDYSKLKLALENKFGGNWIVLNRLHPRQVDIRDKVKQSKQDFVIDVTTYPDIQELLTTADVVITDYSSCIYDFILTRRPGFIYAPDYARYNSVRGLYYPLEETPFPIAANNDELISNIEEFDYNKYKNDVEIFLDGKGCIDNGHASEKVVELIKQIISEET